MNAEIIDRFPSFLKMALAERLVSFDGRNVETNFEPVCVFRKLRGTSVEDYDFLSHAERQGLEKLHKWPHKCVMSIDEAKINLDNLQIDKVLASYDGPMLFVNKDADGNYYLAYCCDVDEDEYVIAATSVRDLITMLENDKTVYSVFQKSSNKWKVHSDSSVERVAKFNDLDLLDDNVYLKNLGGSFEDYAEQLRSEEQTCAKRIIVHLVRDEYSRILTFNENYKPFFSLEKFSKEPVSKKFNVWHSNKIVREAQECLV